MAITLDTNARNNLLDNGAGAAYSSASVSIKDVSSTELVVVTLPAMPSAASGSITAGSQPTGTVLAAAGAGTNATQYTITLTGGGTETGTVTATAGGGDIELDDINLIEDGIVTITSFVRTQPAS